MKRRKILLAISTMSLAGILYACGDQIDYGSSFRGSEYLVDPGAYGDDGWETCPPGGGNVEPEPIGEGGPPYKKNPDVQCTLIAKYNGDIDGGFDTSGGSYDKFKKCMTDAGCFSPTGGTRRNPTCDEHLKDCQEHLVGKTVASTLILERDFGTITADEWRAFGTGL